MPLLTALLRPFFMLKEALSVGEDYWTWTTVQGEVYEDVILTRVRATDVTINHKYGVATIPRADLSPEIQKSLIDNSLIAEPDHTYSAAEEHDHYLHSLPMAHAK